MDGDLRRKPQAPRPFEIKLNMEEPSYMRDDMRMSQWTGKPLAIYNLRERARSTDPETAARAFLRDRRELIGFADANLADLVLRNVRTSLAGTTLRFTQWQQGVQVYETETVLNISPDGYITFVLVGYKSIPQGFDVNPTFTESAAKNAILSRIGLQGPLDFEKARLVIYQFHETTRLAWNIRLAGQEPYGDWESLVDAKTGEIFRCEDVSCYYGAHRKGVNSDSTQIAVAKLALPTQTPRAGRVGNAENATPLPTPTPFLSPTPLPTPTPLMPAVVNGTGNTFDADPLSSAGVAYGGAYVDGADANAAVLTAQLQNKVLPDITLNAGVHSLVGPYAQILDFEAPNKGLFTQASSVFNFDRNADAFEAVNTYWFLDQSLRYINTTLGISLMPYQYVGGIRFDPSGLSGADNSHYIGSTGRIAFGEGGVDDAEDSDVILHELGHGLHDWATSGGLSQVNGLSEGCGDYWAQSYSRSKNQWTTLQPAYHYVFSWDGHNPFWGGRTTNYGALYPGGLVGQIHTDGQIWATCLMKIYNAIGRTKTDMAFLEGLMLTNSTTNQQDAAIAFRQAGINMGYTMGELIQITNFLTGCGYILPPFPVLYNSFTASRLNSQYVNLNWETSAESQNTGFEIQRRLSSETEFSIVGFERGHGTTDAAHAYAFQDINPSNEMSFYRLRQIDSDGNSRDSEVLAVSGSNVHGFSFGIHPNPVKDRLKVVLVGLPANHTAVGYRILDLAGRMVVAGTIDVANNLEIESIAALPAGVYMLELTADGQSAVQKFVKE